MSPEFSRENCEYQSCYCEENVYKMCERLNPEDLPFFYAVFISNPAKKIPLFSQKSGQGNRDGCVVWDYHVIMLEYRDGVGKIFDLDTSLSFPSSFNQYFFDTIRPDYVMLAGYERLFRVIPADKFLENFSSDRSHMKRSDGSWNAPPPPWDTLWKSERGNNIHQFISMDSSVLSDISTIYTEDTLFDKFRN